MEDKVVVLNRKVISPCLQARNEQVTFAEKPQMKINSLNKQNQTDI